MIGEILAGALCFAPGVFRNAKKANLPGTIVIRNPRPDTPVFIILIN
jgi:hypothetical protein